MCRFRITLTLFGILFISANLSAQDTHYWNLQYGTRSTLLGGAVIGSVTDMAATYYNPAAPALFPKPEILISGKVYQYSSLSLVDGAGPGKDLEYSSIEAAPSIFAGSFTFDWLGNHTLSYSILTRQHMNFGIEGRRGGESESDPNELVAGELIVNQELSDLWVGLTWAKKLTDNIAIGLSPYVSVRNQKTRKHAYNEILDQPSGDVSAGIITQQFEYRVISLVTKLGIGAKFESLTIGLTLTSPYVNLSGTGSSLVNLIDAGLGTDPQTTYIANNQLEVDASYDTPLSVGFGLGYSIGKHRLHLSAEWFDDVNKYNVLNTNNFLGQSDGATYANRVNSEAQSVINYGIGGEFYLKEKLWLFASFVTDNSAYLPGTQTNLSVSTWDISHISGGLLFSIGKSEFNVGINYSFGASKLKGPVNLPEGGLGNDLADLLEDSDVDYKRIKFLIGFSFELQ